MKDVRDGKGRLKVEMIDSVLKNIRGGLAKKSIRHLEYLQEKGTETWVAAIPNNDYNTVLSAVEFRDELRDRYELGVLDSPSHYDGCNNSFTTTHALACKVGGLIHSRHDESRDSVVFFAYAGFQPSNIRDESLINPCRDIRRKDENTKLIESTSGIVAELNSDRGDLLIRGFWDRSTDCIIDVRIFNVNQSSYLTHEPASIIKSAENSKKSQYLEPCLAQREDTLLRLLCHVNVCLGRKLTSF